MTGAGAIPRRKPAEERRGDLLDAGLELFGSKGFAQTTIADIVARAGVAQGTFYLQFSSKDALLAALQDRFEDQIVARAQIAIDKAGDDWFAKLDALVVACFEDYDQELDQHDVLFAHVDRTKTLRQDGDARGTGLVGVIAVLLEEGSAAGTFTVDDVEVTALLLFSALHGGFDEVVHLDHLVARERLVAAVQMLFRRVVAHPEPIRTSTARPGR